MKHKFFYTYISIFNGFFGNSIRIRTKLVIYRICHRFLELNDLFRCRWRRWSNPMSRDPFHHKPHVGSYGLYNRVMIMKHDFLQSMVLTDEFEKMCRVWYRGNRIPSGRMSEPVMHRHLSRYFRQKESLKPIRST